MWWNKKKEIKSENKPKDGDLRIVELTNRLNEKSYIIERYNTYELCYEWWEEVKTDIDTYENALEIKSEIEEEVFRKTIIQRKVM